MMFVGVLAGVIAVVLVAAFRMLPGERWQILATVPVRKIGAGQWDGVNLTWYGALNANAYAAGAAILFVLMGAVGISAKAAFLMVALVLMLCVPASRLIARTVEKKSYTFTVGGASFVGMVIIPWVVILLNMTIGSTAEFRIHLMPALSALVISYAFGEGLGRLACVSFGCCYGKRLSACPALVARLFHRFGFVFNGDTKKIAYEGGMEGEPVLPIQAITSVLYLSTGLCTILLYLESHFLAAFVLCIIVTQGWRVVSEVFRADYRGTGRMTAYQIMSIVGAVYSIAAGFFFTMAEASFPHAGVPASGTDIMAGLRSIWDPGTLLFLQALWAVIFLYTGRSMVTGSCVSFYVHKGRI